MSRIWNELTTPPASTHLPYTTLFRSLLRAGQGRSEDRQQRQQVGEHQAEVGDVTGGEVSHLVADHEAQRLGVAAVAAYLEHVGVDDHVASETVTDGEGVDGTAAHHHVRVGRLDRKSTRL